MMNGTKVVLQLEPTGARRERVISSIARADFREGQVAGERPRVRWAQSLAILGASALGKLDEAHREAMRAIELNPNNSSGHASMANNRSRLGGPMMELPRPIARCSYAELPTLVRAILKSRNGKTERMAQCRCSEMTWFED